MGREDEIMNAMHAVLDRKAYLDGKVLNQELADYTPAEVHTMIAIETGDMMNVTQLAQQLFVTRGAVSKVTKRLLKSGCLSSYKRTDNKKELYFKLTAKGLAVYQTHQRLSAQFAQRDAEVFDQLSDAQFDGIVKFFNDFTTHLDAEIEKD